jgi:molybdate transport system substrate-binding protein
MKIKTASVVIAAAAAVMVLAQSNAIRAAAEIKVLSSNGIRVAMQDLIPEFEKATGNTVAVTFGLSAALKRRIDGGEAFDVVILTPALIDDLVKRGSVAADSRTTLARSGIGLAIRSGAPKPDIRTIDALKRTLLASKSITYAKEGAGGVFFTDVMQKLGLTEGLKSKVKPTASGEEASAAVARGDADFAVLPVSEIMTVRGIEVLGTFPPDVQGYAVMVAGVSSRTAQGAVARDLIKFVMAPVALPVLKKRGMERG